MTQSTPHITDHQVIHLIGIGGCSMNGLAQVLAARGYTVRGSDSTTSPFTERLAQLGIPVTIGQAAENVEGADLVIYSAAIKADNPERVRARELGIPELERSQALGQLSQGYKTVVGVAGCHGKTTITSMLAMISQQGGLDATVHIGGFTEFLQGGTRIGSQDLFITEACEYVGSFLTLHPTIAIINNIDNDHLDYYKTIENIQAAFQQFIGLLPQDGWLFACTDDPRVRQLFGLLVNVAAAQGDHQVARVGVGDQVGPDGFKGAQVGGVAAGGIDGSHHVFCMDGAVVHFPAGIDIRHQHLVRLVEAGDGSGKQGFGPGIAVALEHAPELFVGHAASALQGGLDLGGVVGVVVIYPHAPPLPVVFKPASGISEFGQGGGNVLECGAQVQGYRCGGHGIDDLMGALDVELDAA